MKNLILVLLALSLSACGFQIVDPGYRGIETSLGKIVGEPLPEGLHFYNPFTSDIEEFSIRQDTWASKTAIAKMKLASGPPRETARRFIGPNSVYALPTSFTGAASVFAGAASVVSRVSVGA